MVRRPPIAFVPMTIADRLFGLPFLVVGLVALRYRGPLARFRVGLADDMRARLPALRRVPRLSDRAQVLIVVGLGLAFAAAGLALLLGVTREG